MQGTALTLSGRLSAQTILPWILHRGQLLDLNGWVERKDEGTLFIVLAGPEALIDAMEAACSLGPAEAMVETITRGPYTFNGQPGRFTAL
ncbi:acylphosphatase [Roseobacter sp. S98]|uniref:acylphosphatase n=1 Tax=Roseobacter algicola (ex Choi et al. 2025) (nom. illeg.) TaxID=3092138 RepID=UPI003F510454